MEKISLDPKTKLEEDMKVFFPAIYKLMKLSESDHFYNDIVDAFLEMREQDRFGELTIKFQAGRINRVMLNLDLNSHMPKMVSECHVVAVQTTV